MTAMQIGAGEKPQRSFQEVWVISFGHALTHWYPATFYLLLPLIGNELGLSFSQIGSILTCQFAAGALSNLPGGMLVDAIGRKGPLMAVALSWVGLPYLVMGFSYSYWMLMLSLGSAVRAMTAMTLLTFLPVFLANELGYSPAWVGGSLFALQAAGFAAAPLSGHLSDRMGRRNIIMTSMAMSGVVLLFMAFAGRSPAFALFVAFLGFFLFAIRAVLQAWVLDATPRQLGGTSIGILFG